MLNLTEDWLIGTLDHHPVHFTVALLLVANGCQHQALAHPHIRPGVILVLSEQPALIPHNHLPSAAHPSLYIIYRAIVHRKQRAVFHFNILRSCGVEVFLPFYTTVACLVWISIGKSCLALAHNCHSLIWK